MNQYIFNLTMILVLFAILAVFALIAGDEIEPADNRVAATIASGVVLALIIWAVYSTFQLPPIS